MPLLKVGFLWNGGFFLLLELSNNWNMVGFLLAPLYIGEPALAFSTSCLFGCPSLSLLTSDTQILLYLALRFFVLLVAQARFLSRSQ